MSPKDDPVDPPKAAFLPIPKVEHDASLPVTTATKSSPASGAFIQRGSAYNQVAQAALNSYGEATTARQNTVQARAELRSQRFERLPTFTPSASASDDGKTQLRLDAEQTVYDFGRFKARREQAEANVQIAQIEEHIDQNQRIYEALELYLEMRRYQELAAVSGRFMGHYNRLANRVRQRVNGGVADQSEVSLVDLKTQELSSQQSSDMQQYNTAASKLSLLTKGYANDVITNAQAKRAASFGPLPAPTLTPDVRLALAEHSRSIGTFKETRSSLMPRATLDGYVTHDGSKSDRGVSINLKSDVGLGFGTKAKLTAAKTREVSAGYAVRNVKDEVDRRRAALDIAYETSQSLATQANRLNANAQSSINQFYQLFELGRRPLIDVLSVYQSARDAERRVIDVHYDMLHNRLQLALLLGALAPDVR